MKLIRKPVIPATIAVITDLAALVLAVLLNILRGKIPAAYSFDSTNVVVKITHPYDYYGIFTAVALLTVVVMSGLIIAAAISGSKSKAASRGVGAAALLIISVAVVLFSHYVVRGLPAESYTCFVFEDGTDTIAIQETKYIDGTGTNEVFRLCETEHDHDNPDTSEHKHYSVELLTGTEIKHFATDSTRYTLDYGYSNDIVIRFMDGDSYRSLNIKLD